MNNAIETVLPKVLSAHNLDGLKQHTYAHTTLEYRVERPDVAYSNALLNTFPS